MLTSGLVIMLEPSSDRVPSALTAIRAAPSFIIGEQNGDWLSLALEADNAAESERWHDWLQRLPGVLGVEVVFVHQDDLQEVHADA